MEVAFPPKAEVYRSRRHFRKVPQPDSMHRSNDEAMSSFRQACGLQSPGGYLIAEFWA